VLTFVDDATPSAADDWAVGEVRGLGCGWGCCMLDAWRFVQPRTQQRWCGYFTLLLRVCDACCVVCAVCPLCCAVLCPSPSSQVGGFEAYLLADEEEEQSGAAAVYRQVRGRRRGEAGMQQQD
jgi:hypothetical protein